MDRKEAYQEKVEAQLEELNARIGLLEAKAAKAKAEAKVQYGEQLEELHRKRQEVEERLEGLQAAGSEAWHEFATGVDEALSALENAVTSAVAQFG